MVLSPTDPTVVARVATTARSLYQAEVESVFRMAGAHDESARRLAEAALVSADEEQWGPSVCEAVALEACLPVDAANRAEVRERCRREFPELVRRVTQAVGSFDALSPEDEALAHEVADIAGRRLVPRVPTATFAPPPSSPVRVGLLRRPADPVRSVRPALALAPPETAPEFTYAAVMSELAGAAREHASLLHRHPVVQRALELAA